MSEDNKLFNELKKLSKQANQRIVRLEKLTGQKESFATKQLIDYLSSEPVSGITKQGRIRASKSMSDTQMINTIKATKQFLESSSSTEKGVKQILKEYETKAEKPISFKQANILYQSGKSYEWIYEDIPKSDFWSFVQKANESNWSKETFIEQIQNYMSREIDTQVLLDLEALYYYVKD